MDSENREIFLKWSLQRPWIIFYAKGLSYRTIMTLLPKITHIHKTIDTSKINDDDMLLFIETLILDHTITDDVMDYYLSNQLIQNNYYKLLHKYCEKHQQMPLFDIKYYLLNHEEYNNLHRLCININNNAMVL